MIDLLSHREPFYEEAMKIFSLSETKKCIVVVSSLSYATVAYIFEHKISHEALKEMLRQFSKIVEIASVDSLVIEQSIANECLFKDIEDTIQYHTALSTSCDAIITRNVKRLQIINYTCLYTQQIHYKQG